RDTRKASGWAVENDARMPGTLWDYGHSRNTGAPDIEAQNHPARWPYKLAEDILRCFCPPDGLACDPFLGAGTSAVAALEHGRRFVGGDLGTRTADPARGLDAVPWVDVAARVLDARSKQVRRFGPGAA
ncbi:MAG TPA: DNA methyltransferase, partial [Gemmatimonadaceae bacterium]|nr:DNA methyltransferase [Gemmatimonadaceae bacterium]